MSADFHNRCSLGGALFRPGAWQRYPGMPVEFISKGGLAMSTATKETTKKVVRELKNLRTAAGKEARARWGCRCCRCCRCR